MSGLEILGGVAAAASLAKVVATVIVKFGTRQNAPRQVKRLEGILEDLQDNHLIESASQREKERLTELFLVAEETLRDHSKKQRQQPNALLKFFWPEGAEEKLKGLNDELEGELMRLGLRVDRRYRHSIVSPISPITLVGTPTGLPSIADPSSPPRIALPSTPTHSSPSHKNLSHGRRATFDLANPAPITSSGSSKSHELPATLYLQDPYGVNVLPPLKVKYLRVLERDESTRLIHYERKTANHHLEVTHRIPRSCLRFEDDNLSDSQIHFLDAHPITVFRSGKGHEVYFLHAKYEFTSVRHREDFISKMLERELLGRFYAQEILYRGQLHAQGKVVRLWRKGEGGDGESGGNGKGKMVTKLTYLAREERQWEWNLERFDRRVEVDEPAGKVTLVEADSESMLVIKFPPPPRARKQSTPVPTSAAGSGSGTTTAKKRERTLSSQTMVFPGPEDKQLLMGSGSSPPTQPGPPERKKSTWSLRKFSRTSVGSIGKETTLSPDIAPGLRSPDSLSPSSAVSSPAMSHASDMTEDNNPSTSSSNGGTTTAATTTTEVQKSDAEKFRDIWKEHHPSSVQQFVALPPIVTSAPMGLSTWAGLGVEMGGRGGGGGGGDYTTATTGAAATRLVGRSPSTSPRGSPFPVSPGSGSSSSNIRTMFGKETAVSGSGGSAMARNRIPARLEDPYPP